MTRPVAGAVLTVMLLGVTTAEADEVKGTVTAVSTTKSTITLTVDGKAKTYPVAKDASFTTATRVAGKKKGKTTGKTTERVTPIDGGLAGIKTGASVTVLTETIDDKESVTSVKVSGGTAASLKKKKKKKE